ncbi:hypothetical protein BX266_5335 [Streptomyces sp. TLI_171]|nr:hypothetical protein BX266_5335 [Streptomyces sp. TLI_171]
MNHAPYCQAAERHLRTGRHEVPEHPLGCLRCPPQCS